MNLEQKKIRLEPIADLQEIRGVPFPAGYKYRQFLVTGPPGAGKSTIVQMIRGWPIEGYIDLSEPHWWRMRSLAYRPREVHLGLPFIGRQEALTVFDEAWLEAYDKLELDYKRIQIPPDKRPLSFTNWRKRYVFEFLLPPAEKAYAWREDRAKLGLYPADENLTFEIVQRQYDIYLAVAVYLQDWGMDVYVRDDLNGAPLRIIVEADRDHG